MQLSLSRALVTPRTGNGLPAAPPERVALAAPVELGANLTFLMPVKILADGEPGVAHAAPRPTSTSGDLISLGGTDGFVELPGRQPAIIAT